MEHKISVILKKPNSPILTIPGMKLINGACILGEIGDISGFSNAAKLAAYAGIDTIVRTCIHKRLSNV